MPAKIKTDCRACFVLMLAKVGAGSSVSNSGQIFKTGFRIAARKRTGKPVFFGF